MRRSQAPRAGWGGQGSREPSLCLPPFPSFLPSLPLLSAAPEQPGSWSAAMDRYSMEELIQLGQGRAGLGWGRARVQAFGREGSRPPAWAGPSPPACGRGPVGAGLRILDEHGSVSEVPPAVSQGSRPCCRLLCLQEVVPPGVRAWSLLRRSLALAFRAGPCRPVPFRIEFLKHGVDGQEAWVGLATPPPRRPWPPNVGWVPLPRQPETKCGLLRSAAVCPHAPGS